MAFEPFGPATAVPEPSPSCTNRTKFGEAIMSKPRHVIVFLMSRADNWLA